MAPQLEIPTCELGVCLELSSCSSFCLYGYIELTWLCTASGVKKVAPLTLSYVVHTDLYTCKIYNGDYRLLSV